jgi:hypothetical protein
LYYSLAGRQNATVEVAGETPEAAEASHPQVVLTLLSADANTLTPALADPVLFVTVDTKVGPNAAVLVEQKNGLGDVTLSWSQDGYDYQLNTQRLLTSDGESGVRDDVLVRVAESLR